MNFKLFLENNEQEASFLLEYLGNPKDTTVLHIYCDWLEEHGDPQATNWRNLLNYDDFTPFDINYKKIYVTNNTKDNFVNKLHHEFGGNDLTYYAYARESNPIMKTHSYIMYNSKTHKSTLNADAERFFIPYNIETNIPLLRIMVQKTYRSENK